jgi:hypothetical protein
MIILLAPSKTLDFTTPVPPWLVPTVPLFLDQAQTIASTLAKMDKHELAKIMHVSDTIATVNHQRFATWGEQTKAALWAYRGDVYKGMYADQLSEGDAKWAQEHLLIMSGLYGALRPFDAISPYRLEMKAKLQLGDDGDLYAFWGHKLTDYADERADGIICNLASDEYARPVTRYSKSRIITPVFIDHRPGGKVGPAPIYNKMMRGVMAHWMIKNCIDTPDRLHEFTGHGYTFDRGRSTADAPAFIRDTMTPLKF